jgi:hypothetical protein
MLFPVSPLDICISSSYLLLHIAFCLAPSSVHAMELSSRFCVSLGIHTVAILIKRWLFCSSNIQS